jgi:hypothetical protein
MPPVKPPGTVSLFNKFASDAARTRIAGIALLHAPA